MDAAATALVAARQDPSSFQELTRLTQEPVLRAGASTDPNVLAGALSEALKDKEHQPVKIRAMGAPAIAKMVKATAQARALVAMRGEDLVLRSGYEDIMVPDTDNPGGEPVLRRAIILNASTM